MVWIPDSALPGACLALALLASGVQAQPATDFDTVRLNSFELAEGFHVLSAPAGVIAGNVLVSTGEQGTLIVDSQLVPLAPALADGIRELGGGSVDFAVNTHWHFDHADGNQVLGPAGTWIIAHENARLMMMQDNEINLVNLRIEQPAYPLSALPVIGFDDAMHLHFNSERIDLLYFGPAHTDSDIAVFFRGRNAVHMGDVFNNDGYPFIDTDNGGSLNGLIRFCEAVLERSDMATIVVPGHGPVADQDTLVAYVEMLTTIRDRMAALIASGASLPQVVAARPTAEWDDRRGNPAMFIDRAYHSLVRDAAR